MEIKELIADFLDLEENERIEGRYLFYPNEEYYLEEIPKYCYYKIVRQASEFHYGIVSIIFSDKKVTEIFSINKVNIPTYVSRKHDNTQTYEAALEVALQDPGQSIVLYGPSKLGKSALWKSIINDESILVQCNHSMSIGNIYKEIVDEIQKPNLRQIIESDENTIDGTLGGSFSIGTDATGKVGINSSLEKSTSKKTERVHEYIEKTINAQNITKLLVDSDYPIIFENYHRLNDNTLKNLCIDLRTFADENINTIFVGIPTNPYVITELNNELLGRIVFMDFEYWKEDELIKIATGGAEILNIEFEKDTLSFLCKEAVGSPLLMQLFCLITCLSSKVTYRQDTLSVVSIDTRKFKMAMKNYGQLYLAPCSRTWVAFNKACNTKNVHDAFFDTILNFIKSNEFELSFNLNMIKNVIDSNKMNKLISKLNKNSSTVDFLVYNDEFDEFTFGQPLSIVYARWLL